VAGVRHMAENKKRNLRSSARGGRAWSVTNSNRTSTNSKSKFITVGCHSA
jgi:hypothetical protein